MVADKMDSNAIPRDLPKLRKYKIRDEPKKDHKNLSQSKMIKQIQGEEKKKSIEIDEKKNSSRAHIMRDSRV